MLHTRRSLLSLAGLAALFCTLLPGAALAASRRHERERHRRHHRRSRHHRSYRY